MTITRDDLALYVTGNYDGDAAALEAAIASDDALRATLTAEAKLETLLRDAAAQAVFCVACHELVHDDRCDACGAAVHPGGYVVERVLVTGPHGRMYVARDADGQRVALKELAFVSAPKLETINAFEREAKFLRALAHPAIPRFVASFEEGRGVHARYYLAQELVDGVSLAQHLDQHWYDEREISNLAREVLDILVYLQGLSPIVIHRDLKPANLIRRDDGTIALVDFGAAHVYGATVGVTAIGTFGYMPTEQLAGEVDATTDLYALGCTLIHLLTRQEPWRAMQGDALARANVSAAMRAFLNRLVAPKPRDRFESAPAARRALDDMIRGDVPVERTRRRNWWKPIAIAAGVLALPAIGALGESLLRTPEPSARTPTPTALTAASPPTVPSPLDHVIDTSVLAMPLPSALGVFVAECGINVVASDDDESSVPTMVSGHHTSCRDAITTALASVQMAYDFDQEADLVRVATPHDLAEEKALTFYRPLSAGGSGVGDPLPEGPRISHDLHEAPVREVIDYLCKENQINVVMPESLSGRVTVVVERAPWRDVLAAVLASQGLAYRYSAQGRILRVATRHELEAEVAR